MFLFQISKIFEVNNELVGDIQLDGYWDKFKDAVGVKGNLIRDEIKTFDFAGFYYVNYKKNNLDMKLNFDHTDIAFLNAFSDPELYTNIKGNIDGDIHLTGELDNPIIVGDLNVEKTTLSVPMFNVDYQIDGVLDLEEDAIFAERLVLTDELGNEGIGKMQVLHSAYTDWNYDVTLEFDNENITKTFLAMNTSYKEGDIYYGKAFITGTVNIFGYDDLTQITVDVKTEKGTDLTLPLYGTEEAEENSFVKFYDPDTANKNNQPLEIERLGLTLDMDFEVTKDAKVNIVFDPVLNDQIVATGEGDLKIKVNDYGDVEMEGKYTIIDGKYYLKMNKVVAEEFEIIEGSNLVWSLSPYDAVVDIKTRFERQVDMSDIIVGGGESTGSKDLVYGYLNLSEKLSDLALSFDIEAPNARDEAKNALPKK